MLAASSVDFTKMVPYIRMSSLDFQHWLKNENFFSLFFYCASKGNLGATGVGGVFLAPMTKLNCNTLGVWGKKPITRKKYL